MTSPPDHSELASALLDGALPADEAARAAADPEVGALADEFRNLRSEMQDLPPAPDIGRAGAVAAAVEAAHAEAAAATAASTSPRFSPPPQPPGRQNRPWLVALAGAAASVVLVLLAVGVVTTLGDKDNDADVTAAADSDDAEHGNDAAPGAADDSGAAEEAEGGSAGDGTADSDAGEIADESLNPEDEMAEEPSAPQGAGVIDLGSFDDVSELAVAVRDEASSERTTSGTDSAEGSAREGDCPAYSAAGDPRHGDPGFAATAVLDGVNVWVHLYPLSGDEGRLIATDSACATVADRAIAL